MRVKDRKLQKRPRMKDGLKVGRKITKGKQGGEGIMKEEWIRSLSDLTTLVILLFAEPAARLRYSNLK